MRLLIAAFVLSFSALIAAPAAAQEWFEAETNNFIIKSRSSEEDTRKFAVELERFDMGMRTLQDMPIGVAQPSRATKLTVYRFGDVGDIGRLVPGAAGFYIARAGESVAYTPARKARSRTNSVTGRNRNRNRATRLDEVSVLQHEYVHYFMLQNFPAAYPAWYVEGYAELLASMRFNEDGSFHIGDPPQYRAYQIFRMSRFRLEEMLDQKHKLSGRDYSQFYGTGWLLAHYLNFNPERLVQLNEYLLAIGKGEDSLTAAKRIFGDLDAIDKELLEYRDGPFPGMDITPADYIEPQVTMRALSDAEKAVIRQEVLLGVGADEDGAASLARNIRGSLSEHPGDAHILIQLARAEEMAENYDALDLVADQLIAAAPDRVEGLLYKSSAAIGRIDDDPKWSAPARDNAIAAAAKDMNDPRPRIAYYYSFIESKETPPDNAAAALEGAYDMAGSDVSYRFLLGHMLVTENELPLAKSVLLPIAFRGHDQGEVEEEDDEDADEPSLDKVMTLIDAGDRDGALTMMNDMMDDDDEDEEA